MVGAGRDVEAEVDEGAGNAKPLLPKTATRSRLNEKRHAAAARWRDGPLRKIVNGVAGRWPAILILMTTRRWTAPSAMERTMGMTMTMVAKPNARFRRGSLRSESWSRRIWRPATGLLGMAAAETAADVVVVAVAVDNAVVPDVKRLKPTLSSFH